MRRLSLLLVLASSTAACEAATGPSELSIATSAPATDPVVTPPPAAPAPPAATTATPPAATPTPPAPPPAADVPVVATKRVFVTSAAFTADLKTAGAGADGFDGGDRLCTNAAHAAGLAGSFRAFLSGKHAGADVAAPSRVPAAGAYVQLDGQLTFVDPGELAGAPRAAITTTETMQSLVAAPVWTATNLGKLAGTACEDAAGESWSSTTSATPASMGITSASTQWTFSAPSPCNATAHLYCFED